MAYQLPEALVQPTYSYVVHTDSMPYFGDAAQWLTAWLRRQGLTVWDTPPPPDTPNVFCFYIGCLKPAPHIPHVAYAVVLTEQPSLELHLDMGPFYSRAHGFVSSCRLVDNLCAAKWQPQSEKRCVLPLLWAQSIIARPGPETACRRLVLQYGEINQRRLDVHRALERRVGNAAVLSNCLWGDDKTDTLHNTKVVCAAAFYPTPHFVTVHRIAEAASAGCLVVAEHADDVELEELITSLGPAVTLAAFDALADVAADVFEAAASPAHRASLQKWREVQHQLGTQWDGASDWRVVVRRVAAQ